MAPTCARKVQRTEGSKRGAGGGDVAPAPAERKGDGNSKSPKSTAIQALLWLPLLLLCAGAGPTCVAVRGGVGSGVVLEGSEGLCASELAECDNSVAAENEEA